MKSANSFDRPLFTARPCTPETDANPHRYEDLPPIAEQVAA